MKDPSELFSELGGNFLTSPENILKKYSKIHAVVFDWDGVFNSGVKFSQEGSLFSEPDAMGTNLLRFNYFLLHKKMLRTFMITGMNNTSAVNFGRRENFDAIFLNYKHKEEALEIIGTQFDCSPDRTAFICDDVLDLGVAKLCLLAFFVRRKASPLTEKYVRENQCCDYVTGREGGEFAVREICELLIGLTGRFNETIEKRIRFQGSFKEYSKARQKVTTQVFTSS
ncbi:phosphatase [bacterium]|nr:phosphatase [bacterium]MCI0603226.1 phosphatase [bacterium]